MQITSELVIRNIGNLYGIDTSPYSFKKGKDLSVVESISDAFLHIKNGQIEEFGLDEKCTLAGIKTIDAKGGIVCPTYVDTHTHIVFATSREEEYVMRLKGASYEAIAESGGGILNSAKKLADATFEDLYTSAKLRLDSMIAMGTGVVEIKSGYGLSFNSEIKMLEVIKALKRNSDAHIKATFLGAHAIPMAYKTRRSEYIDLIVNEMLPYIAEHQLADYCDVFCDKGFFTVDETRTILTAALKYGIKGKIHANELGVTGGVQVGIECEAISVDHLECTTETEWKALAESNTIPTLLPGTSFFLDIPYGEARKMVDYGLGIVLASDFNPGSTPSGNMAFLQSLACLRMKLLPTESFNACTYNAAAALECQEDYGSITKGKVANIQIMTTINNLNQLPYYYGQNPTDIAILKGKIQ